MLSISNAIILICAVVADSFIFIPKQAKITYVNHKFLTWANASVTRYGRKSPYYLNMEGENKVPIDGTFILNMVVYQFVSNEYRRSFVEFHMPFCEFIKDPYFGGIFGKFGYNLTCPIIPGPYHFMNLTFPTEDFPHVWPFEKCLFNITMTINNVLGGSGFFSSKIISNRRKKT
ncbi:hypothetical protein JYU34_013671 [Plutella xylostella]|uniref:Uncharacterized protein n=1 Tax=Plutella xylostella TaxID=51655 RepID=A0ABQ7QAE2_PLUXY|nr:hypothetical protein JYU34_013671 [Plutella xylostella]